MTISDFGALGEFLGFFAVLATLVYLGIQARNTKQIAMGEAARAIVTDFLDIIASLVKDDEFVRLVRIGVNDWDELNNNEKTRVHLFFSAIVLHFDGATRQEHIEDLRDFDKAWESNLLGLLVTKGGRVWWEQTNYAFNPPTVERLNARINDPATLPPSWHDGFPWWATEAFDFEVRSQTRSKTNAAPNKRGSRES